MRILQQFKTIPLYIEYFLKVVDCHSLQAPYVFDFYSKLIEGLKQQAPEVDIEMTRKELKRDDAEISVSDLGAGSRLTSSLKVSSIARLGISSQKECRLLSQLISMIKPGVCLELGTSLGLTSAYLSRSMPEGVIYTFEGNPDLCQIAKQSWLKLQCENIHLIHGDIDLTLPQKLEELPAVHFAIIDANHTESALLTYFNMIIKKMAQGGIILIDDIRWSMGMYDGWKKVRNDAHVSVSMEFLKSGLVVIKEGIPKQHYFLSI